MKRYEVWSDWESEESAGGEWCRWEDVKSLVEQIKQLQYIIQIEREATQALKKDIENINGYWVKRVKELE